MNTIHSQSRRLAAIVGVVLAALGLLLGLMRMADAQAAPAAGLNPKLPSLFVIGDSTANNHANGALGWGDPFQAYFDTTKINVLNRARAGRSSRTFVTEGLWDKTLADIKKGDFVLIQFGHNDSGLINDVSRARGSLPGLGEETQEIDNLQTKQHEVVHTFGWYMRKFVADTRAKGATPIVLSLTVRNIWTGNTVERGPGKFSPWSGEIAKAQNVSFVDLTNMIADQYEKLGPDKVKPLFGPDHTHTSPAGGEINAATVVAGLKGLKNSPFLAYLSDKGIAVKADPAHVVNAVPGASPTAVVGAISTASDATSTTSDATSTTAADTAPGPDPVVSPAFRRSLPMPANPKLPTLYLIGDSTVRNGQGTGGGGMWGWGEPIVAYFDTTKINVVNRAVGGLSSRTYLTGGHWDPVVAMLKPGDFVMMQFGHNDGGAINDASRARASLKGVGEETQEIDNMLTKQHEVVHTYGWYLRKFITDAKAKGATPFVCSLIPRKTWNGDKISRNTADFGGWAADVAKTEKVGFVDLNNIIADTYDTLGPAKVEPLFGDPHTHTSLAGAEINAACVIAGLKALPADPLAPFFSAKSAGVGKAEPGKAVIIAAK